MIYSNSSAEHSICNNVWSHSKLNLCNEGENISFALTCISGFHAPLPFRSWTVQSFALFSVCNSLACHTIFGMSTWEELLMFLASLWNPSMLKSGGRRTSWSCRLSWSVPPQGLWQVFSAWSTLSTSSFIILSSSL